MNDRYARERSLTRAHCLFRLEKLRTKIEEPDWGMDPGKEVGLLLLLQSELTIILHDLGVECYIGDDLEIADQLDNPS